MSSARAGETYRFRLFVAGDAQNAAIALANLTAFCHAHLEGRHAIEVVDVFRESGRALAEVIFMTPTLVRVSPLPVRRIIGTLDDERALMRAIGLEIATT